ncbi:MAG: helix-turn-helix transcriptional regulator [Eubacterium sp.]|jgi:DNA-binding HxlR family transcriptional regulator|nr:helix-turn-helix transcriptional regulator [Eubacterium sp.]MCI9211263.1 helix-turn-helix transcriptional regulator [Eubacterium sp.]
MLRKKSQKEELPPTAFEQTVALIGNKWKLMILKKLMSRSLPWHLTELKNEIAGIDQTVLKVSLQSMEKDGLIESKVFRDLPPKVEYTLTDLGASMQPILAAMETWGESYGH